MASKSTGFTSEDSLGVFDCLEDSFQDEFDIERDFEDVLDANMKKIFRAELAVGSKSAKSVPKPRKFLKCKQCLLHPNDISRYSKNREISSRLRVKSWTLEASHRLRIQKDFHKDPRPYTIPVYTYGFCEGSSGTGGGNVSSILTQSNYKTSKKFAVVRAKNELEKFLLELQTRDITPEDYEKLLELDEKVKAKTCDARAVSSLPTRKLSASDASGSDESENATLTCVICMDSLTSKCVVKELPCGHLFHSECISKWLTKNSCNCPVDQMPFQS